MVSTETGRDRLHPFLSYRFHRSRRLIVRSVVFSAGIALSAAAFLAGCADQPANLDTSSTAISASAPAQAPAPSVKVTRIEPGPDARKRAQTALIEAAPGDVVEFDAGRFEFDATLSLDVAGVTIRGAGPDKTILSFKNQGAGTGGEGLLLTGKEKITVENLAVEDARGDAVKASGIKGLVLRNIKTSWSGGPKATNGGYGLYPVMCTDLLIEGCTATDASDSGIYVGQSKNIIVRRNTASKNVAGIEIENSIDADVYENLATDNAGGILVFTMPDLPQKDGRNCRVYDNRVVANNHENFAPKGNTVASVPSGTGLMVLANKRVEVFNNKIENNQTVGLSVVSYMITGTPLKDTKYDPFPEGIYAHDNTFTNNGGKPAGALGETLAKLMPPPLPDILFDGVLNPNASAAAGPVLRLRNNGKAGFANFDAAALNEAGKTPNVVRDLKAYEGELPALPPVKIAGVE
jgi:parallel beta-helix repeat protein